MISPTLGVGETAGKPSLRGLRERPAQPELIAPAPDFACAIFHLPLRSFAQYRSRLEIGLRIAKTRESERLEERITEVLGEHEAEERWRELIGDDGSVRAAVERGELVEDTRLRDLMRAIGPPEPDVLEPQPYSVQPPADALAVERAEITREALAGLTHNHAQALGERDSAVAAATVRDERLHATRARAREQAARLRRKLVQARKRARKLERRLRRVENSRWWRLRPRRPGRGSKRS